MSLRFYCPPVLYDTSYPAPLLLHILVYSGVFLCLDSCLVSFCARERPGHLHSLEITRPALYHTLLGHATAVAGAAFASAVTAAREVAHSLVHLGVE